MLDQTLDDSHVLLHESLEGETFQQIIDDFYPNLKNQDQKVTLFQAILIMNEHNSNIKEYKDLNSILKSKTWFILPTYFSPIVQLISNQNTLIFNTITIISHGINENFKILFNSERNINAFNAMVRDIGLNETLSLLEVLIPFSAYQNVFWYQLFEEKITDLNCKIDENTKKYKCESENLYRKIFKESIEEYKNKFTEDKLIDNPIISEMIARTADWSKEGSLKASEYFSPFNSLRRNIEELRREHLKKEKFKKGVKNGTRKSKHVPSDKSFIYKSGIKASQKEIELRLGKNLKNTLKKYFHNNKNFSELRVLIDSNHAVKKAKSNKYNKTLLIPLSHLTPTFKYISRVMGLVKWGLTSYDVFSRIDSINEAYSNSARNGNRAVFQESFGFGGCLIVGIPLSSLAGPTGFIASIFVNTGVDWGGKELGGYAFDFIAERNQSFNEVTILEMIKRSSKINFFAHALEPQQ